MMAARPIDRAMRLSELLGIGTALATDRDPTIRDMGLDSRAVTPGTLFCALPGARGHGLDFADQAVALGAVAILTQPGERWSPEAVAALQKRLPVPVVVLSDLTQRLSALAGRFHGEPAAALDLIAVTGTNGKTSVAQFVAQTLERCASVGTLGYGFLDDLTATTHTTPDAIRLQAIFSELKARGAVAVAMEMSSHALDQGRAAALPVDTAVFTNLTRDHLDYHRDMESYARAKQRLFRQPGLRHAVINADDPFGQAIRADLHADVQAVMYGVNTDFTDYAGHWLRGVAVQPLRRGSRVRVDGSWGEGEFTTALLGGFNVANLLAVLGVLLLRELPLGEALRRLGTARGAPGRMECFGSAGQPLVVVDYAHTPDALEHALTVLRAHRPRRLLCLFGCGGERDTGKRPQMGAVAERLADRVLLTDDNPRGEDGGAIVKDILSGMRRPERAGVERNRGRAIRQVLDEAGAEDIVLVAGKGHETTQRVGDLVLPFSDREQVRQSLKQRGGEVR
jgi:UDP-N-acetylmuramoyl-L-alanyl-D-glutamate--2,6-diaminopimelate ligase